jgi:rSAM/selenodomain-associated transferase 2
MRLDEIRMSGHEIIIVDGGSTDGTLDIAGSHGDKVVSSGKGRAIQMNAGASVATGDVLVFLHADTSIPPSAYEALQKKIDSSDNQWGRFDVCLSPSSWVFTIIASLMNFRSRLTGIATGDQCIFITRSLFDKAGGYPPILLMEDIAICKRLKAYSKPICLHDKVITSSRRWHENGIIKTILTMWLLRLAYSFGANPGKLYEIYYS